MYKSGLPPQDLSRRSPSLETFVPPGIIFKNEKSLKIQSKKKLVRVLRDEGESRLLDNSLVLNGVQILNNLSKVSHCNPPKSEEIFKQLIL